MVFLFLSKIKTYFINIANNAAFLLERSVAYNEYSSSSVADKELIEVWKKKLEGEKGSFFYNRLALLGIYNEKEFNKFCFGNVYTTDYYPHWIEKFEEISTFVLSYKSCKGNKEFDIPFEKIIRPFASYVFKELQIKSSFIKKSALLDIERYILESISNFSSSCFYLDFSLFKENNDSSSYIDFISNFFIEQNYFHFFEEYPVLARQITEFLLDSIAFLNELLNAFYEDYGELSLSNNAKVLHLKIGLSDKHQNHKSVVEFVFSSKFSIFYKPRNTDIEQDFCSFLKYLKTLNPIFSKLDYPKIISKKNHSWVEKISYNKILEEKDLVLFYEQCGIILFICHLLNGTDFHYENIVCNGRAPVLIDTETLIQPISKKFNSILYSSDDIELLINSSVLMTLLLPQWYKKEGGKPYDISGFSASFFNTGFYSIKWHNANSDLISPSFIENKENPIKHSPQKDINIIKYKKNIIEGFKNAYVAFCDQKMAIRKFIESNNLFREGTTRVIMKPTLVYSKLIETLKHPKFLRRGIFYSIEIEQLMLSAFEAMPDELEMEQWLNFFNAESQSLYKMNIPIFHAKANSLNLSCYNKDIFTNCFATTGYQLLQNKISAIDKDYYRLQKRIISDSIDLRYENQLDQFSINYSFNNEKVNNDYLQLAINIAEGLQKESIVIDKNKTGFLSYSYNNFTKTNKLEPTGHSLLLGTVGINLFLSALYKETKQKKIKESIESNFYFIMTMFKEGNIEYFKTFLGQEGLGGYIYGLSRIGKNTKNEKYTLYSKNLIESISEFEIINTRYFDQVFGLSGLLEGLITYVEVTGDSSCYNIINFIAEKLIKTPIENLTKVLQDYPVIGFSHGISGVASAMIKLYKLTENESYIAHAYKLIEYENNLLSGLFSKNKLDWANGLAGIGKVHKELVYYTKNTDKHLQLIEKKLSSNYYMNDYSLANGITGIIDYNLADNPKKAQNLADILISQLQEKSYLVSNTPTLKLLRNPSYLYGASGLAYIFLLLNKNFISH